MSRSHSSAPNLQEPPLVMGEPGIGRQRNSLRPSSARYSFARGLGHNEAWKAETPGPADYDVSDYASALGQASAIVGTSARIDYNKGYQTETSPDAPLVDTTGAEELRYPAAPCATFGMEVRDDQVVVDPELIRACPESRFGRTGPGFIYTPDDRRVRPNSAFAYSMRHAQRATQSAPKRSTPDTVSPAQYKHEAAIGVQLDSRRKTARSSSFGTASRFAAPKPSGGELTAECKPVESCFGGSRGCRSGKALRRAPAATFGSATRTSSSRARLSTGPGDCPTAKSRFGPPRMPHPTVAPQKEILRYNAMMPMR